ncbi:sodium/glutamate symporter [Clostridium sp.]|uniref:sodium/glutamate symporter n=1 Tax=Clostridium sp. TaxID=1506 RepID=UPI002FC5DDB0
MIFKLDMVQTAAIGVIVLFIGQFIKSKVNLLEKYCIPSPVIGGLLFAIITLVLRVNGILTIEMDATLQKLFMTMFFTTIGFTASFKLLKKGGAHVIIFLVISIILVLFQDITGVFFAKLFNLNPLLGLSTGSVALVGGLGTSGAFGPVFEKAGAAGATTVAIAAATFGLVVGSMIGGPIAKRLIEKNNILGNKKSSTNLEAEEVAITHENSKKELIPDNFMNAMAIIFLAMGIGTIISTLLQKTGMTFPAYIGAMVAACILRNISDTTNMFKIYEDEIDILGNVFLSLFLAMALMSLQLWLLAELALPLIIMLCAQTILMILFAYFITFNFMGKDYDAAVIASGICGFGMGASANAMANMETLSKKFGPSPKAFLIVPLVGSLFIDFFNAGIITVFMNFFGK